MLLNGCCFKSPSLWQLVIEQQKIRAFLVVQVVKNCLQCRRPGFHPWLGKIPLEKGMATHSSILAWEIPEESGRLQSMGSHTVTDNQATNPN